MNEIKINMENLNGKEREQLLKLVEKANQKPNPFEIEFEGAEMYWFVNGDGEVCKLPFNDSGLDRKLISFGNACKDKEYVERRAKEIKLYNLLSNFAHLHNEGWEPDWTDDEERKFSIYYSYDYETHKICTSYNVKGFNEVYFKSEELAKRAIDEIVLPFERGEL